MLDKPPAEVASEVDGVVSLQELLLVPLADELRHELVADCGQEVGVAQGGVLQLRHLELAGVGDVGNVVVFVFDALFGTLGEVLVVRVAAGEDRGCRMT